MAVYQRMPTRKIAVNSGKTRELTTISFDLNAAVGQFISAKRDRFHDRRKGSQRATVDSSFASVKLRLELAAPRGARLRAGQFAGQRLETPSSKYG
jgi:hypothetical protein